MVAISTTTLRTHHAWLAGHAQSDKQGKLRCIATDQEINSRTHHFYRLQQQGCDTPFVDEADLPDISGSADGSMISFALFSCPACNILSAPPARIRQAELVRLRDGLEVR